ncbi:MAG: 4Fe-4S binding protein, partial [Chlorobiales bacterium]|nr:4Fe-4S binding protein [Chlorobiales bacterium]
LSKLFCSYICPIGTISEWFGKLGDKIKVRITIKGILDKVLRSLKYVLLFITLYYTLDSSELFCKKFDPYYAVATGFDMDVVVLWASIGIFLVIIASVFIRLFWCKYICPFGALANVFKFTGFFIAVLLIYIIILKFGIELSYVWPLAVACVGGYIIEISNFKNRFFPVAKITRNNNTCTDCQLCSINCPQAIDVANVDVVRDADCNLCSECIISCPAKDTLQINKRKQLKWLPPISVVVLTALGMYIGTFFEVPTIDQQWYEPAKIAKAEVYSRSDLKNITCYGSSVSFANQMRKVNGVMGVQTYVGSKTVKIFYDPQLLDETKIEEAIFTAQKSPIRTMAKD